MGTEANPAEAANKKKSENFERPFTPRTWLRSASNFGKTRFGRFATFHFSTSKIFFREFFGSKILFFDIFVRISRSYAFLDFKIRLLAIFCSRYTYSELCTAKNLMMVDHHDVRPSCWSTTMMVDHHDGRPS